MGNRWSEVDNKYLKEHYPYDSIKQLCEYFQCNKQRIYDRADRLGLKKIVFHREIPANAVKTQFKKGMTSWNKGLKLGSDWGKRTQFKPGQEPHNKLPEELQEVALLRRRLTKNINERIKRYDKKQNTRLTQPSI